jgi:hypothetical protein
MKTSSNNHSNKLILKIIIGMIFFPLVISLFVHFSQETTGEQKTPIFDTTSIHGYSFFKTQGIQLNEFSDARLYNAIYPFIGMPHRNRSGGRGPDCSGLVKKVYIEAFGDVVKGSSRDMFRNSIPLEIEELAESDLVFFTIGSNQINHVGIYLNNSKFVHVSTSNGVEINDLRDEYYRKAYYKSGRIRK